MPTKPMDVSEVSDLNDEVVHKGRTYTVRSTWSGGVVCTLAGLRTARKAEDMIRLTWTQYNEGVRL